MLSTANDVFAGGEKTAGAWDMTVLELAIFMSVYRATVPPRTEAIARAIGSLFERVFTPEETARPVARMVENQWLEADGDCFKATASGREAARPLMSGLIRMLDHGTRLLDVALLMTLLRLTKGELDDAPLNP